MEYRESERERGEKAKETPPKISGLYCLARECEQVRGPDCLCGGV